jgi:transposase, IS30 family
MSYTHLSRSERFTIYQLRTQDKLKVREVAEHIGRSVSTIYRELKRNHTQENLYLPDSAHLQMQQRRQHSKQRFMSVSEASIARIKDRLKQYHSPEQISGRMKRVWKLPVLKPSIK